MVTAQARRVRPDQQGRGASVLGANGSRRRGCASDEVGLRAAPDAAGEDLTDEDLLLDEEPGTVSLPEGAGQKRKAKSAPKKKAKKPKKTDEWDSDAESEDEQDNADGDY